MTTTVLLAGCGQGDSGGGRATPTPTQPSVSAPAEFIGYGRGKLERLGLTPTAPDASKSLIVGLGYSLSVDAFAVSPTLTPAMMLTDARASSSPNGSITAGGRAVQAAAGHEFVVVQLGSGSLLPEYSLLKAPDDKGSQEKLSVQIGGRRPVALGGPRVSELLVVSAPVGAPVTVTAADGRPQSLDLRTGQRINEVAGLYPTLPKRSATAGPSFSFRTPPFGINTRIAQVQLTPAEYSLGWAPVGQAWLVVPIAMTVANCGQGCDPESVVLDMAKSAQLDDGTRRYTARQRNGKVALHVLQSTVKTGTVWAVFQVPATFRRGTLRLGFNGSIRFTTGSTNQLQAKAEEIPLALS
ncbi:hypothetical protein [Micromonospora polyrhachis]|uniref:Uncharacterized protein n=1 Tax=Micromonospora polyrhachis TaxID=1282883 RepID=A0A7W7WSF5_9ACTN|nr:hypothetical protein [Micromonospora polyrhachis]MBB4961924.1 hypothetical protein [Micromonospora polyrhachis]